MLSLPLSFALAHSTWSVARWCTRCVCRFIFFSSFSFWFRLATAVPHTLSQWIAAALGENVLSCCRMAKKRKLHFSRCVFGGRSKPLLFGLMLVDELHSEAICGCFVSSKNLWKEWIVRWRKQMNWVLLLAISLMKFDIKKMSIWLGWCGLPAQSSTKQQRILWLKKKKTDRKRYRIKLKSKFNLLETVVFDDFNTDDWTHIVCCHQSQSIWSTWKHFSFFILFTSLTLIRLCALEICVEVYRMWIE